MNSFGYYKGNLDMEEHLVWGYKKKCDAFSGSCVTHPHKCQQNAQLCSPDYHSLGICAKDSYAEQCDIFNENLHSDCRIQLNKDILVDQNTTPGAGKMYFGNKGRCIMGVVDPNAQSDIIRCTGLGCNALPNCMRHVCAEDGQSIEVFLPEGADKVSVNCQKNEANAHKSFTIDGTTGAFILCPNPTEICFGGLQCPDDCNSNGRCLKNRECWCYHGWKGTSCAEEATDAEKLEQYTILDASKLSGFLSNIKIIGLSVTMFMILGLRF